MLHHGAADIDQQLQVAEMRASAVDQQVAEETGSARCRWCLVKVSLKGPFLLPAATVTGTQN